MPHCPCLTIYRTDGSSYPTTQAPPPPQGFGNLKTAKTFEWVHMKCCPASFCLKDSSCPPSPPTHHPPKRFLCQDEEEVPGSGGLLAMRGCCSGAGAQGGRDTAEVLAAQPGSLVSPPTGGYLFRESDCIRFPDKVASSFAFLSSSFFLAASSRCFRMIASRARSALACSVFPAKCIFM